jgi:hypothetical protein
MLQQPRVELTPEEVQALGVYQKYFATTLIIAVHANLARCYKWMLWVVNLSSIKFKLNGKKTNYQLAFYPCADELELLRKHQESNEIAALSYEVSSSNENAPLELVTAAEFRAELAQLEARKIPLLTQLLKANQTILPQLYTYCNQVNDSKVLGNILYLIDSLLTYSQTVDLVELTLEPSNFINGALITTCINNLANDQGLNYLPSKVLAKINTILRTRISAIIASNQTGNTVIYNELLKPLLDNEVKQYIIDNNLITKKVEVHFKQFFDSIKLA